MMVNPSTRPMSGARTMKMRVLVQPVAMIEPHPALTTAAPANPPISACDELVGKPKYQVIRSHTIAPMSAAKITENVTMWMSTRPAPTVFATAVPNVKAAMKLNAAAQMTALPGDSTRVDTTVAIEFAAS